MQSPPLKAIELTSPLTAGAQDVIVYGAMALKLNTLVRGIVLPPWVTWLKLPTAYIVSPHWTICRI